MNKFRVCFEEMVKTIELFATSQEQELLLERAGFILQRGLREF